ncbi:MAG: peptidoglycan bridge formation glycyltransferase FemA/FemB family protein [bacterium]|nr:peptidoglycan bridge formation glycyltransferase FemA/FemB family protein [Candidatus Aquidulcis sp.]
MSPVVREESSAWGARLRAAATGGHLTDLPFVQQPAWAASKALTGWESVRLVAQDGVAWVGAQFLIQRLPAGLGRIAYAPRGPIVVAPNEAVAATLRAELLRGLTELRSDGVTLVRLEPGNSTPLPDEADQVNPADDLSADLRAPWQAAATTARITLHRARPVQPSTSRRVDLTAGMETVRAAWRSKWRQYARHATESTNSGNELRAPYALKVTAMERAVARGSATYDMWGISTAGIAHFKAGWGGVPVVYPGAFDLDLDPIRGPLVRLALRLRGFGA